MYRKRGEERERGDSGEGGGGECPPRETTARSNVERNRRATSSRSFSPTRCSLFFPVNNETRFHVHLIPPYPGFSGNSCFFRRLPDSYVSAFNSRFTAAALFCACSVFSCGCTFYTFCLCPPLSRVREREGVFILYFKYRKRESRYRERIY